MAAPREIGLVWFRRDLRLDDNPAWATATSSSDAVVPLFVLDDRLFGPAGPHRRRQLLANLQALDHELFALGQGRLLVRVGRPEVEVPRMVEHYAVSAVHANADVSPFATARDHAVSEALVVPVHWHHGTLVRPPGSVRTRQGTLSRVFTPFYRAWLTTPLDEWPQPGDALLLDHPGQPLPAMDGPAPLPEGPAEALTRLEQFVERVDAYADDRDRLDVVGTSGLSVDLKYGTVSPRTVLAAVGEGTPGRDAFVRQLAWRDWYAHLLLDVPTLPRRAMREVYDGIAWRNDPADIEAWTRGVTGVPVVDGGMRQLAETGWMPNRVRMLCGSFLVKNLLVDWRIGERHFRHLLVDGDVSQNVGNWQWVAGTGPDASPYNRIFNPVTQARRFDPDGSYVRRWVPELRALPAEHVHAPWEAPPLELAAAGVQLGVDYPEPITDLRSSRERALATYGRARDRGRDGEPTRGPTSAS